MQHVLVSSAKQRPRRHHPALPDGAFYDATAGLWRMGDHILARTPEYLSGRISNKADQETGEDQKGE
jgi:hypothetical protein